MTPLHYGLAEYLADQDEGLHPSLQHQRNDLDPPEFCLNAHLYLNPQLCGAVNEQPIFGGCGRRGSTSIPTLLPGVDANMGVITDVALPTRSKLGAPIFME